MCSCKILCYLCSSYWHRTCVFQRRTHLRLENEQAVKSKENGQRKKKCTNDLENTAALVTAPTMQAGLKRLAFQEPPAHHTETWFARLLTTKVIFFFRPSRTDEKIKSNPVVSKREENLLLNEIQTISQKKKNEKRFCLIKILWNEKVALT